MLKSSIEYKEDVIEVPYKKIKNQLKDIKEIPILTKEINHYYIIQDPNDPSRFAGFIGINTEPREEYNIFGLNKKELGHDIELVDFWVDPNFRSKGIGSRLLKYVLKKYENYCIGMGTGKRTSEDAKRLYKKFGFKIVVNKPPFNWWLKKKNSTS